MYLSKSLILAVAVCYIFIYTIYRTDFLLLYTQCKRWLHKDVRPIPGVLPTPMLCCPVKQMRKSKEVYTKLFLTAPILPQKSKPQQRLPDRLGGCCVTEHTKPGEKTTAERWNKQAKAHVVCVDMPRHVTIRHQLSIDIASDLAVPPATVDVNYADHVPLRKRKVSDWEDLVASYKTYCQRHADTQRHT